MISVFERKEDCCGCTACEHICPTKAVKMELDQEGFLYPIINQEMCIDCGCCRSVCAFQNGYDKSKYFEVPIAYGVKHRNDDVRIESRSGGMFTALSDKIISKGGVVFGVGYCNHFKVSHKKAINRNERDEFRGSKYVQSDLKDIFIEVENELINGKDVLFTGTPCQTAGLNRYLALKNIPVKNLLVCDLICHGTPSPKLFKDYIEYLEKKHNDRISSFEFRNKKLFGWKDHRESYIVKDKTFSSKVYTNLFYEHSALRPSCYNCKYTNMVRPSDITLADFWGVDEIIKDFNDNKGVSLVFLNTIKGERLFDEVKEDIIYKDCTGLSFKHSRLKEPVKKPKHREIFWIDYHNKGFKFITKKYGGYGIKQLIKKFIKGFLLKVGVLKLIRNLQQ